MPKVVVCMVTDFVRVRPSSESCQQRPRSIRETANNDRSAPIGNGAVDGVSPPVAPHRTHPRLSTARHPIARTRIGHPSLARVILPVDIFVSLDKVGRALLVRVELDSQVRDQTPPHVRGPQEADGRRVRERSLTRRRPRWALSAKSISGGNRDIDKMLV